MNMEHETEKFRNYKEEEVTRIEYRIDNSADMAQTRIFAGKPDEEKEPLSNWDGAVFSTNPETTQSYFNSLKLKYPNAVIVTVPW